MVQVKWHIGSQCRCKYSEDGLIYDATIISLDEDGDMCTVRYAFYNNEEHQRLCDLLLPSGGGDAHQQNSSMASDVSASFKSASVAKHANVYACNV